MNAQPPVKIPCIRTDLLGPVRSALGPGCLKPRQSLADYQWAKTREFISRPHLMKAFIYGTASADWSWGDEDLDALESAVLERLDTASTVLERATLAACETAIATIQEARAEDQDAHDDLPYRRRTC